MKITLSVVALVLSSTFASAGVLDDFKADLKNLVDTFPAHEQDGYLDTGCDVDFKVAVKNADGDILYFNNPTCPDVGGAGLDLSALSSVAVVTPVDPKDPCKDDKPVKGHDPKGPKK